MTEEKEYTASEKDTVALNVCREMSTIYGKWLDTLGGDIPIDRVISMSASVCASMLLPGFITLMSEEGTDEDKDKRYDECVNKFNSRLGESLLTLSTMFLEDLQTAPAEEEE